MTEKNDVTFFRVKGHVNLDSPRTDADKMYRKFLDDNSKALNSKGAPEIGFDDFRKLIDMNNRADELANIAMDELR